MTHYIVIIDIDEKAKEYKVVNALSIARPGEKVYFCNYTDQDARIEFDAKPPFESPELVVKGGNRSKAHELGKSGCYPFTVHIGGSEAKASKPIIIIYD